MKVFSVRRSENKGNGINENEPCDLLMSTYLPPKNRRGFPRMLWLFAKSFQLRNTQLRFDSSMTIRIAIDDFMGQKSPNGPQKPLLRRGMGYAGQWILLISNLNPRTGDYIAYDTESTNEQFRRAMVVNANPYCRHRNRVRYKQRDSQNRRVGGIGKGTC